MPRNEDHLQPDEEKYYEDVAAWLLTTQEPPSLLSFLVRRQFKGTAYRFVKRLTRSELLMGGFGRDGMWRDPAPLILDTLRIRFAELDKEPC